MDLGRRNREYWSQYAAGTTPGLDRVPASTLLETLPNHSQLLDVGTGTGKLAEALAKLGLSVFAIDINPNEIDVNSNRGSEVEYSTQDITKPTAFSSDFFDLLLFRYTLTNIHKDQWRGLATEVNRLTKPGGYVWLAEPTVNQAYTERYNLGKESLGDEHALYVFKDKDLATKVKDTASLESAIAKDQVARIVRHYDESELLDLFPQFEPITIEHFSDTSPSGYPLDTVVMTLQKTE